MLLHLFYFASMICAGRHLADSLANPIQEKLEEWRKSALQLDKDRLKETKRVRAEIKRSAGESMRLSKKAHKKGIVSSGVGGGPLHQQLNQALSETTNKYGRLMETERSAVRRAMVEERQRFCYLVSCVKPLMVSELLLMTRVWTLCRPLSDMRLTFLARAIVSARVPRPSIVESSFRT